MNSASKGFPCRSSVFAPTRSDRLSPGRAPSTWSDHLGVMNADEPTGEAPPVDRPCEVRPVSRRASPDVVAHVQQTDRARLTSDSIQRFLDLDQLADELLTATPERAAQRAGQVFGP